MICSGLGRQTGKRSLIRSGLGRQKLWFLLSLRTTGCRQLARLPIRTRPTWQTLRLAAIRTRPGWQQLPLPAFRIEASWPTVRLSPFPTPTEFPNDGRCVSPATCRQSGRGVALPIDPRPPSHRRRQPRPHLGRRPGVGLHDGRRNPVPDRNAPAAPRIKRLSSFRALRGTGLRWELSGIRK